MIRSIIFVASVIASTPALAGQVPTVAASAVVNPPVSPSTSAQSSGQNGSSALASAINDINYDFASSAGIPSDAFNRPVQIQFPSVISSIDSDILTLAKIIEGKLEFYGGRYNTAKAGFAKARDSF